MSRVKGNTDGSISPKHIALIPCSGMGVLTAFLRLASMLLSRNCMLTLITPRTKISSAESNVVSSFAASHPQIRHLEFDAVAPDSSGQSDADPFEVQYDAVSRSAHLVLPLLSSASPPIAAVFGDLLVAKGVVAMCKKLAVPYYTIICSSAKFLSFALHLPNLVSRPDNEIITSCDTVEIPGLPPFPMSSIPRPFLNPNHIFGATLVANIKAIEETKGIAINTFEWFEKETLDALNCGKVVSNLPPVFAIGPLEAYELEKDQSDCLHWLDKQPMKSVVYVSFGSRTALPNDQIRELRNGLERSGCRFLWVVKTNIVDKEDKVDVRDLLGASFLERTKSVGLVVKGWVNQQEILKHKAIGCFVSYCGWNSVTEAAHKGVPVLAWPPLGDHRLNAEVVEKAGLGIWDRNWGMGLVKDDEIAKRIVELMHDDTVKKAASKVGKEANKATEIGGSSEDAITNLIKAIDF